MDIYFIFFGKYLSVEWLDHIVVVYLTFPEIAKLLSKEVILFTFPLVACENCSSSPSLPALGMVAL